jgi:hypothetical protein
MMATSDRVKVTIDLNKVATNLRAPDGGSATEAAARSFMKYAGFSLADDETWVGLRSQLGKFNPGEVLGVEPA